MTTNTYSLSSTRNWYGGSCHMMIDEWWLCTSCCGRMEMEHIVDWRHFHDVFVVISATAENLPFCWSCGPD